MARRIHQVEFIVVPILRPIGHRDRMRFDRDAALPLKVHRVEMLIRHRTLRDGVGVFEQAIGQRSLAVVDVCDNAEIAGVFNGHRSGGEIAEFGKTFNDPRFLGASCQTAEYAPRPEFPEFSRASDCGAAHAILP